MVEQENTPQPDEKPAVSVESHIVIRDTESGEVLVKQRG